MKIGGMLVVCVLLGTATLGRETDRVTEDMLLPAPWEIGPEVSSFHYREPGYMKEDGWLVGIAGAYDHSSDNRLFRIEGAVSGGLVDYDGHVTNFDTGETKPYSIEGNRDFLFGLRLLWGAQWTMGSDWYSQLLLGFGYRGLNDDSSQDPNGYDRQANYFYLPVGLKAYWVFADRWQIGFGGELDVLLLGLQLSDVYRDGNSVVNVQNPASGFGARVSAEIRHRGRPVDLALAPFVQYWWVDDSAESEGWVEPRNNSLQYGLGLIFRF